MDRQICTGCEVDKFISEFYRDKRLKSGIMTRCKVCIRHGVKERSAKTKNRNTQKPPTQPMTKTCSDCGLTKSSKEFNKNRSLKDGLCRTCKSCNSKMLREWATTNPEKKRQSSKKCRERKLEKENERQRKHYWDNREAILAANKKWRDENPDKVKAQRSRRREKDLDHIRNVGRVWEKQQRAENIQFRLRGNLRRRLGTVLRTKQKVGSAVTDLGCNCEELVLHLKNLFNEGMCWENYGKKVGQWSIDHVMPLSAFDLEDRQHFLLANHYLNLRPMWHVGNCSKNDSIPYDLLLAA